MAKTRPSSARRQAVGRRKQRRRQRQLIVLLVVAGAAALVVVGLILISQNSAAVAVENIGDYSAFPQGIDESGAPYLGEPDAPVTLVEYSDFACPHCNTFSKTVHRLADTYVADGSLKIVFKPMSFINPQTSPIAAAASLCAAEQGKFWEMHDALFSLLSTQGSNAFSISNMVALAGQIGLADEEAFEACLRGGDTTPVVNDMLLEAQSLGVNSTPTIFFNGQMLEPGAVPYDTLEQLIEGALSQ